jgi:hypothetical protein
MGGCKELSDNDDDDVHGHDHDDADTDDDDDDDDEDADDDATDDGDDDDDGAHADGHDHYDCIEYCGGIDDDGGTLRALESPMRPFENLEPGCVQQSCQRLQTCQLLLSRHSTSLKP